MGYRKLADWQVIIEQQEASGLTIVDYCREHQLSVYSFAARKRKLRLKALQGLEARPVGFVQVIPAGTTVSKSELLMLQAGNALLQLPSTVNPRWLGQLLREMSR